jgi:hypothetical protein
MRTFIQLKDGIGWASVNTTGEIEGAIEVDSGTGEQYIKKAYNNGEWSDAPLLWFAEIGYDGSIIEVRKTYFASEIGDNPILTPDIKPDAKWLNGEWVNSVFIEPAVFIASVSQPVIDSPEATTGDMDNENAGDTV